MLYAIFLYPSVSLVQEDMFLNEKLEISPTMVLSPFYFLNFQMHAT